MEESIEGNKLIAEFMGAEWRSWKDNKLSMYRFENPIGDTYAFHIKDLKYHSSWDWLMPVVEKIESLGYCVFQQNDACWIKVGRVGMKMPIISNLAENKKEATWLTVVEFIKWYNQNK